MNPTDFRVPSIALSFTIVLAGATRGAADVDVTGEWTGKLTVQENGQEFTPSFRFEKRDGKLSGVVISAIDGTETRLEDVRLDQDKLSFRYSRDFQGTEVKASYTCKVSGDELKGTAQLDYGGQEGTGEFTAKRKAAGKAAAGGIDGKWKVMLNGEGQTFSTEMTLKRKGEKLEGTYVSVLDGEEVPIEKGSIKGKEIRFEVSRERDGQRLYIKYKGDFDGKTIKGKVEFDAGVQSGVADFEAERAE